MTLTIEERMTVWLNDQADECQIPDEERQQFIDHMRGTFMAEIKRVVFAVDDVHESHPLARQFNEMLISLRRWRESR